MRTSPGPAPGGTIAPRRQEDVPQPAHRRRARLQRPAPPLADAAVAEINRIYRAGGLRTALELGRYLVHTVFADSRAAADTEHPTWRALAERDDLEPSHSVLWGAVRILDLYEQLPADTRDQLGVSAFRRLLAVKDDDKRVELAVRAASEPLTVADLERAIADEQPPSNRGRKPVPAPLKAVRAAAKQLARVETDDLGDRAAAQSLLQELDAHLAAARALRDRLEQLVEDREDQRLPPEA